MNAYLKLMRVDQYIKNIIVLLPLLFSSELFAEGKFLPVLLGTFMFCLVSSAVYIMNDIADADSDAKNPAKCNRPIPSGKVKKNVAIVLCVILVIIPVAVSLFLLPSFSAAWILIYFVMNIAYSLGLKNVIVLDVVFIVAGFVIRAIYGSLIADIETSKWLYYLVAALVTFTTVGKRVNEKRRMERTGVCIRKVIENVSERTLLIFLYLAVILLNIFYIIWVSGLTVPEDCATNPLWTIPFMILFSWESYVIIQNNNTDHDPLPLFVRDKMWILTFLILIVSVIITFYVEVPFINDGVEVFR